MHLCGHVNVVVWIEDNFLKVLKFVNFDMFKLNEVKFDFEIEVNIEYFENNNVILSKKQPHNNLSH